MAIEVYALRSLRVYEETSGNFAADHSGTPGDFLPIPAQPDSLSMGIEQAFLDPNILTQHIGARSEKVLGPKEPTLSFTVPLHCAGKQGSVSEASATKDDNALFRILATTMGGVYGGTNGSKVSSASSGSVITVTSASGFTAGGCIGWTNGSSQLEMVPIESISSNVITTKMALSSTPSTNDDIYVATTFYIDDTTGSHLQFLAEGNEDSDLWSLRGFQLTGMGFSLGYGEMPTMNFEMRGADWAHKGSASLSVETYNNYEPIAFNGGTFLTQQVGTATRSTTDTPSITIEPQIEYIPAKAVSSSAVNTVSEFIMSPTKPIVSGSFMPYFEDSTWLDAWSNRTFYLLALQVHNANSRGCLIEVPNSQIGPVTGPQDSDGLSVSEVSFEGDTDDDTATSTKLGLSAFRLHFIG